MSQWTEGHSCAVLDDNSVSCWGRNAMGQLGDGTTTDRLTPVTVSLPTGRDALTGPQVVSHEHVGQASQTPASPGHYVANNSWTEEASSKLGRSLAAGGEHITRSSMTNHQHAGRTGRGNWAMGQPRTPVLPLSLEYPVRWSKSVQELSPMESPAQSSREICTAGGPEGSGIEYNPL